MFKFNIFGHQSRFDRLLSVVNLIAPLVNGHFPDPFPFCSEFSAIVLTCLVFALQTWGPEAVRLNEGPIPSAVEAGDHGAATSAMPHVRDLSTAYFELN